MARLFILNVFFVLVATTTSLTEHNPKSLSQDQSKTLMLLYFRGSALWFQCDKLGYNSTNYTPILCGNDTCHAYLQTQMTYNTVLASLVKDDVVLSYTSPSTKLAARLPLACMSASEVVAGLPYGTQGILGLGNSSTSSVKVMPGNDFGPVYIGPPNRKDVRRLLTSHWGGTKIPYTLLETSIYKALVKAFVGKAQKQKAMYPFTDCFSLKILEENLCFTSLKT
ncbi:hypothetical protein HID58_003641 [Brassica napus]|uniref:Xylanase inhibitor N-terminal domain-containing protein n=1 Tax=Brassica napus TaxID=3708 RepID=A0ABQ8ER18_BRANA|nr:hypothetical protein HID58_003641 [Brassica napus]